MKKVLLLAILGFVLSFSSRAQYVTIPDPNFAGYLQLNFPQCMNGNQLDTTCTALVSTQGIYCYGLGIRDISGIEYFKFLDTLDCSNNLIDTFYRLPMVLGYLNCQQNHLSSLPDSPAFNTIIAESNFITALPALAVTVQNLDFNYNGLTSLGPLPDSLQSLTVRGNQLTALPALPAGLQNLVCDNNMISVLPALPAALQQLSCNYNRITALPALPDTLNYFDCSFNRITVLPALPTSLVTLACDSNFITTLPVSAAYVNLLQINCGLNPINNLPALPPNLIDFLCNGCLLTALPALPGSLAYLDCSSNSISTMPALPAALQSFYCYNNLLSSIPALPPGVQYFRCYKNHLTALPALPSGLFDLECNNNPITALPALPQSLKLLFLDNTFISEVPSLPDSLFELFVDSCPNLNCLPQLKKINTFQFRATPLGCLPNYGVINNSTPALSTLPLCGIYNPNGCQPFWNISGQCYYDANNDCLFDSTDVPTGYAKMQLYSGGVLQQQVYSGGLGYFSFDSVLYGHYNVMPDTANLPFVVSCPGTGSYTDTLSAADSLSYNNNFGFKCRTQGFDIGVQSIVNNYVVPRPGAVLAINTIAGDLSQLYGAHCSAGIAGQLQITLTGAVAYQAPAAGALTPTVNGNTLTYTIADFEAVNINTAFNVLVRINTFAVAGTPVCITANITPTAGDYNPSNNTGNYCFTILDALDPNEKEVSPAGAVNEESPWLTYTIRFQNTGTAAAVNVMVTDTLNTNLDPSTFQLLAYSAKNLTQVFGNRVVFNFPNINLVDSAASDSLSRGFVQYKIKLKPGLPLGTKIANTAYIYFDFNSAVVTNTVTDSVEAPCSITYNTLTHSICQGDTFYIGTTAFTQTGTFSDTLTNAGGCDSVVTLALTVNVVPTATFTGTSPVCQFDTATLTYTGSGDSLATYNWDFYSGQVISLTGGRIYNIWWPSYGPQIVSLSVMENGCLSNVFMDTITVKEPPVVTLSWDSMDALGRFVGSDFCNNNPDTVQLTGGYPPGGSYSGINVYSTGGLYYLLKQNFSGPDTIVYSFEGNGCTGRVSNVVLVNICEGIPTINANTLFTLHPNPADDYTTISFDASYTGATIFVKDITGRQLYQTQLTTSPQQIPTGNLPPGVYLVTMYSNGVVGARLLVKQ